MVICTNARLICAVPDSPVWSTDLTCSTTGVFAGINGFPSMETALLIVPFTYWPTVTMSELIASFTVTGREVPAFRTLEALAEGFPGPGCGMTPEGSAGPG